MLKKRLSITPGIYELKIFFVKKLYVAVFHDDEETVKHWRHATLSDDRIIRNATCGPCSETVYDHGDKVCGGV